MSERRYSGPTLFDEVAPYRTIHHDTEKRAAENVGGRCARIRESILSRIKELGTNGATIDELCIWWATGNPLPNQSTVSGRVSELRTLGYIGRRLATRPTRTGNAAAVWVWTGKVGTGTERPPRTERSEDNGSK